MEDPCPSGDRLPDAVQQLLRRIPERWAEFDFDALTDIESKALFHLVAAGLVERRIRFRIRMPNHPLAAEGTIEVTGEGGFREAMRGVHAAMWSDWKDAYATWQATTGDVAPTILCERLKPAEWRLTDQGVLAREDVDSGRAHVVVEFVLRQGFFDGHAYVDPATGKVMRREPVHGAGLLVSVRKVQVELAAPATVNIGNWREGAEAFAEAFHTTGAAPPAEAPPAHPEVQDEALMTPATMAETFGVNAEALRSRLNRWRKKNHDGWIENKERGPRQPQYLYRVGAVRHLIDALQATGETTGQRPAKKR